MVEVSLRSTAAPLKISPLTRVASVVQPQLDEVSARIARQTDAFDPAIEGYISYALKSGGKRMRPLVALLGGAATRADTKAHIDLAVIVDLIHPATLFEVAVELGGGVNNAAASHVEALGNFGWQLGAVYQIYDDCNDLAGRESEAGKTVGTDVRKGRKQLPMRRLLHHASKIQKAP